MTIKITKIYLVMSSQFDYTKDTVVEAYADRGLAEGSAALISMQRNVSSWVEERDLIAPQDGA
jgi:hypothetical protein